MGIYIHKCKPWEDFEDTLGTWKHDPKATHWKLTLKSHYFRGKFKIDYHMGSAHTGEPDLLSLIECLHGDYTSIDGYDFFDFCDSFGYDRDSITALTTYETCRKQAANWLDFLGPAGYKEFTECEPE